MCKDTNKNTFVDNLIKLYVLNQKCIDYHVGDQLSLDRTIKRMFLNKKITKKYRDKYKSYIDKVKDKIYSDDESN
jgi:hypothetical protein